MIGVSEVEEFDHIILGAGIAGLATAYRLSKAGKRVLVLEKDAKIGGLAKTVEIDGYLFDYCAHRFHTPDPAVLEEIKGLMGDNFVEHHQKSRIRMFGKYLKYPFELQNLLRAMPKGQALLSGVDFLANMMLNRRNTRTPVNYQEWFVRFFGKRLYRIMCEPYTRKIWGMDPSLISSDWADQRFQGPNLKKLIKNTLRKALRLDFSSYSLEDDALAPDSGLFYYPKYGGIQALPDRLAATAVADGCDIRTAVTITAISASAKEVVFDTDGTTHRARAREGIVTTIPLHTYVELLREPAPQAVRSALGGLRYMDIVFVLLFVDQKRISNDTWLYFPDRSVAFNRAVEFKNWADDMAPADKTSLCLDITVTPENRDICELSDAALIERCARDCEAMGLCSVQNVFKGSVLRVSHAYPVYDLSYREKLATIVRFIESAGGVYCLGRTGIFRYQNTDGAIDMAFELSRRLLDASVTQKSIFDYSMKGVSY